MRNTTISLLTIPTVFFAGMACAQTPPVATLAITGDIASPLTLKAEDLAAMPREKVSVPDQDGTQIEYEGVPLREILKRPGFRWAINCAGAPSLPTCWRRRMTDMRWCSLWAKSTRPSVTKRFWFQTLFEYQGPFRLICPDDKAGARSVRMLETLEVVRLKK